MSIFVFGVYKAMHASCNHTDARKGLRFSKLADALGGKRRSHSYSAGHDETEWSTAGGQARGGEGIDLILGAGTAGSRSRWPCVAGERERPRRGVVQQSRARSAGQDRVPEGEKLWFMVIALSIVQDGHHL